MAFSHTHTHTHTYTTYNTTYNTQDDILHTHTHTHTHMPRWKQGPMWMLPTTLSLSQTIGARLLARVSVYMYASWCMCMHLGAYVCISVHMYASWYICMHFGACVCILAHMYASCTFLLAHVSVHRCMYASHLQACVCMTRTEAKSKPKEVCSGRK